MIVLFLFLMLIICGTADILITSYHIVESFVGDVYYYYSENSRIAIRLFMKLLMVFIVLHLYFIVTGYFFPKFLAGFFHDLYKILNTLLDRFVEDE